jgi:DtxR family Mn-dependent transcriptional regulator
MLRPALLPELWLQLCRRRKLGCGQLVQEAAGQRRGAGVSRAQTDTTAGEELLEQLWIASEGGTSVTLESLAREIHGTPQTSWQEVIDGLSDRGLVRRDGSTLELTSRGKQQAQQIVRRHRLAEVLFHQVLELPMDETEQTACRLEHVLSPAATEAVCSFLGHPPACPHGLPIPPGDCCRKLVTKVRPLLERLSELSAGKQATVILVSTVAREGLEQLTDLGIYPGVTVSVRQHRPALVVDVNHTTLAIDTEIARRIFVRPG